MAETFWVEKKDIRESRGIHRRLAVTIDAGVKERLMSKVNINHDTGCWDWTGATRNGYGVIKVGGKCASVHVLMYRIHVGEIVSGKIIRHTCDNRKCCNPSHLLSGSFRDNVRDMIERGRSVVFRGQDSPMAKITNADAERIRAMWRPGFGKVRIAKALGLPVGSVDSVLYKGGYRPAANLASALEVASASDENEGPARQ